MAGQDEGVESARKRVQRSTLLPTELIERARNAVYWCRMIPGEPASYAELSERGLRLEVERLERTYNEGEPFEQGNLRPGPAPGVMQRVARMRRIAKRKDLEPE